MSADGDPTHNIMHNAAADAYYGGKIAIDELFDEAIVRTGVIAPVVPWRGSVLTVVDFQRNWDNELIMMGRSKTGHGAQN